MLVIYFYEDEDCCERKFFLFGRVPGATGMAVIVCDDREKLIPAKSVPVKLGARSYVQRFR